MRRTMLPTVRRPVLAWALLAAATGLPGAEPNRKEPPTARPALSTRIRAQHYEALKGLVRVGDVVFAVGTRPTGRLAPPLAAGQAPSGPDDPRSPAFTQARFEAALQSLGAVQDPRVGKALVFSSVDDLVQYVGRLPRDVTWVDYNSEPGMTPVAELTSIEQSLARFAQVAHRAGRKVTWAPTSAMLRAEEGKLLPLARLVDGFALQHQKLLQYDGVEAMVRLTESRSAAIHRANPQCAVLVQVVIGRGTNEQLVEGLRRATPAIDAFAVFTMNDTANAAAIIAAVRGKGEPRR